MASIQDKIPWFQPEMCQEEQDAVLKVIASNYLNDGAVVTELEKKFAAFLKIKYCVLVTSGSAALYMTLKGFEIGLHDEVIVPDFCFIAAANAVKLTGANVKLVDIEPNRLTIDPNQVIKAINKKTKAVIAVDVNGRCPNYHELEKICKAHGLFLICDSAEAFGSKHQEKYLGTFGDAGCFSFSAAKTISSGQGGLIVTENESLYYRLKEIKDQGRRFGGSGGDDLHPVWGFNFKYTNLQAAILMAQFKKLQARLNSFIQRDERYQLYLKEHKDITFPTTYYKEGEICQWTDILSLKRDAIEKILTSNNIGFRLFWFPLHRQQPYLQPDIGFEESIKVSQTGLWLPSFFKITQQQIQEVCHLIIDGIK